MLSGAFFICIKRSSSLDRKDFLFEKKKIPFFEAGFKDAVFLSLSLSFSPLLFSS